MKKGDRFIVGSVEFEAEKTMSCVSIVDITKDEALLLKEAGFIAIRHAVYSDYLIKVYEAGVLIQALMVHECDDHIDYHAHQLWTYHEERKTSPATNITVVYEKIYTK